MFSTVLEAVSVSLRLSPKGGSTSILLDATGRAAQPGHRQQRMVAVIVKVKLQTTLCFLPYRCSVRCDARVVL